MGLNILEATGLIRQIARLAERLRQVERMLQGQPIGTVRIADLAVTNAKIEDVEAGKILAGDLIVAVDIGSPGSGFTRLDGENNRIIVNDGANNRIVIGDV